MCGDCGRAFGGRHSRMKGPGLGLGRSGGSRVAHRHMPTVPGCPVPPTTTDGSRLLLSAISWLCLQIVHGLTRGVRESWAMIPVEKRCGRRPIETGEMQPGERRTVANQKRIGAMKAPLYESGETGKVGRWTRKIERSYLNNGGPHLPSIPLTGGFHSDDPVIIVGCNLNSIVSIG